MQPTCEVFFFLHLSLSGDVFVIMFTRDRKKRKLKLKGQQKSTSDNQQLGLRVIMSKISFQG